jgi:5-methylcytosine-specific restriction endonuclease McrA
MDRYKIKDWSKFQHFKDRNPLWIKLYRELINDYTIMTLDDSVFRFLVLIWCLSSEDKTKCGIVPEIDDIVFRLRIKEEKVKSMLGVLFEKNFIICCDGSEKDSSENWGTRYISKKVKEIVFKKYSGVCAWCGSKEKIEYDHIIPVSKGGLSEPNNIQLLCRSCNRSKRNQENKQAYQVVTQKKNQRSTETERETETKTETKTKTDTLSDKSNGQRGKNQEIIDYCFNRWNEIADTKPHLAKKRSIGVALKKKMKTRIKEHPELAEWKELFSMIEKSKALGVLSDCSWFSFDCIFNVQKRFDDIMCEWMEWKADTAQNKGARGEQAEIQDKKRRDAEALKRWEESTK